MKTQNSILTKLIIFLLVAGIFAACEKETELTPDDNVNVEMRGGDDSTDKPSKGKKAITKFSGCYNDVAGAIDKPLFEQVYGELTDLVINYTDKNGRQTEIIPLTINGELAHYYIQDQNEDMFALAETASLSDADVAGTGVSRFVSKLFQVSDYVAGPADVGMIMGILGDEYQVSGSSKEINLQEKQNIGGDNPALMTGKLNELCEDGIYLMLPYYADFFGLPTVDPFDYTDLIFDAIVASHPSGDNCVCPIPNVVLENLIPNVTDPFVQQDLIDQYFTISTVVYSPNTVALQSGSQLDCFEDCSGGGGTHTVTICVDQPNPNTPDAYSYGENSGSSGSSNGKSNIDVGHTFLVLEQNINGNTHIAVLGFYPDGGVSPFSPVVPGQIFDDGEHAYDVSVTYEIDCTDFQALVSEIELQYLLDPDYDLSNYNCTDFGINTMNTIGLGIPDTYGWWPLGGGSNPGALGEDLRALPLGPNMTRDDDGGTAPEQNCL